MTDFARRRLFPGDGRRTAIQDTSAEGFVARLNADILKAVQSTEGKAKMEEAGFRVTGTSQQEFARIIAADTVTWGKAVAATGFKAD